VGATEEGVRDRTERWFRAHGLPHLTADYSASRDVFTRALPALTLVFVFEVFGALNLTWPWWGNLLAVAGGFAILLGGWIGTNALRKRPALSRPDSVGAPEIAAFILLPAVLPLAFGGQIRSAGVTAAANVGLVAAIYLGTSYAVVPMTRWAAVRLLRQLGNVADLLVRSFPLLLLFITFLFLQTEVWQIAAELHGPWFGILIGSFAMFGVLFVIFRLPREIGALATFQSWDEVSALVAGTPVEAWTGDRAHTPADVPGLGRRQWGNVGLVVLFGQGLQVLLVSLLTWALLVGLGAVVVTPALVAQWAGHQPNVLATADLWGRSLVVTEELLRVSAFLASVAGLYFTVTALTDQTYRAEFYDEVVADVRRALAVRAVYLSRLGSDRPAG
jgi:hypothetical protein